MSKIKFTEDRIHKQNFLFFQFKFDFINYFYLFIILYIYSTL